MSQKTNTPNANRDPITGEPGSHPIGTLAGALAGTSGGVATAVAMAAAGAAVGPAGLAAGAAIGGIIGGLTGHDIAEDFNPTAEDAYWSETYASRPYVESGAAYDTYQPAYRYGVDSFAANKGKSFDEIEPSLSKNWDSVRGNSTLAWDKAKFASRDAFNRLNDNDKKAG